MYVIIHYIHIYIVYLCNNILYNNIYIFFIIFIVISTIVYVESLAPNFQLAKGPRGAMCVANTKDKLQHSKSYQRKPALTKFIFLATFWLGVWPGEGVPQIIPKRRDGRQAHPQQWRCLTFLHGRFVAPACVPAPPRYCGSSPPAYCPLDSSTLL